MADSSPSSQYDQDEKKSCRSRLIKHAVRCLTTDRSTSACVKRDHVGRVWEQLKESGEAKAFFTEKERSEIEKEIKQWELFHDSQIQTRKPSDLRVCYLGGDNPINDLAVLIENGVLCQNVWAIEKKSDTLQKAWQNISRSDLRNVRLFKGDIQTFLKDFEGQFDIIYFDACGTLPAVRQETLKVIGCVFLHNKLTSPGALITNFSFPPKQPATEAEGKEAKPAAEGEEAKPAAEGKEAKPKAEWKEKDEIKHLAESYLKYRLCNTCRDDNFPEENAVFLSNRTDEENYSDYVTYQVIDSAYLFIPAQRMLSSTGQNSLWDQIFQSRADFLKKTKSFLTPLDENCTIESSLEGLCETEANEFYLQRIGSTLMRAAEKPNSLCKAWVREIFPDWKTQSLLRKEEIPQLLLTPLLFCSQSYIYQFANEEFRRCLGHLIKSLDRDERGISKIHRFCDVATSEATTCMVAGLLYGQMAYPSFPVMEKLLRLRYTAKERQMFSDVFIFDKCRYVYDQFPSVYCTPFAIYEPKQQMVFRMAVDGLRKHLRRICDGDLFPYCNVASINSIVDGGVEFLNVGRSFPKRQEVAINKKEKANSFVKDGRYEEAVKVYEECLTLSPKDAVILSNLGHCYLKLNLPRHAVSVCTLALTLGPAHVHVKALYRRALGFKMIGSYSEAVRDLKDALAKEPKNKDVLRELSDCEKCAGTEMCEPSNCPDLEEPLSDLAPAHLPAVLPTIPLEEGESTFPNLLLDNSGSDQPSSAQSLLEGSSQAEIKGCASPYCKDVMEWTLAESQSDIQGRVGSNACVFIALYMGKLCIERNLPWPTSDCVSESLIESLKEAMIKGNEIHDRLCNGDGRNVTVVDAFSSAGEECGVQSLRQQIDYLHSENPCDRLSEWLMQEAQENSSSSSSQKKSFSVIVSNERAFLIMVNSDRSAMLVDSHHHGDTGAIIAFSQEGSNLAYWLDAMMSEMWKCPLTHTTITPVCYVNSE